MQNLRYVGKSLSLEKLSISNILKKNKTPFYLYSENQIIKNYSKFTKTFQKTNPIVCFAAKSNSNVAILKILGKLGAGADVVSGGELLKALKAGIKSNKIVFSGVGKTEEEIKIAINKKILLINCESESEARLVNKIAKKLRKKVSIGFRLNPNIDAKTHKKISTGKAENKFGLSIKNFKSFLKGISVYKNIKLEALSVHIGSQIVDHKPYEKMLKEVDKIIKKTNHKFEFIDLGGGMGISYQNNDKKLNYKKYNIAIIKNLKDHKSKIIFEPGRSIVGNIGFLISKIIYIKESGNKDFIILDSGMNDFMRPALYGANHRTLPVLKTNKISKRTYEFVGPICESTDRFVALKKFQKMNEKDLIVICDVGAYGMSLSSNYNVRPKPIEILIKGSKINIIKKRQKLEELI